MAKKLEPPQAHDLESLQDRQQGVWLGTVEAPDEAAAMERRNSRCLPGGYGVEEMNRAGCDNID